MKRSDQLAEIWLMRRNRVRRKAPSPETLGGKRVGGRKVRGYGSKKVWSKLVEDPRGRTH